MYYDTIVVAVKLMSLSLLAIKSITFEKKFISIALTSSGQVFRIVSKIFNAYLYKFGLGLLALIYAIIKKALLSASLKSCLMTS